MYFWAFYEDGDFNHFEGVFPALKKYGKGGILSEKDNFLNFFTQNGLKQPVYI